MKMSIVVYSKNNCVFCSKAKALLKNLGLEYEERTLEKDFGYNKNDFERVLHNNN